MDKQRAITALGSALPGLIWTFFPSMNLPPVALIIIGLAVWALYWVFIEPRLHPTADELQKALDKMINYRYLENGGNWQLKADPTLSDEQKYVQHAPQDYREDTYRRLGLAKPKKREPYR
jgi:hypothetical protein